MKKKQDIIFLIIVVLVFAPFFLSDKLFEFYINFNQQYGLIASFIKFAILATAGELIGLRIKTGKYYKKGFGIMPRMLVWGFIGITVKLAFGFFISGTPIVLEHLGLTDAAKVMHQSFSLEKLLVAFSISTALNVIYAPIMMTFHKVTDIHIVNNGGSLLGLFKPIKFRKILLNLNWDIQWNFVIKKTIPLFWIPAHTITFLLPPDFQVLFAALLGIALGIILAVADFT